jgi:hypothetical protein
VDPVKITSGDETRDDKYITFKRHEFLEATRPHARNHASAELHHEELMALALPDAIVIRRQDVFASPALAAYAACISMVAKTTGNNALMGIADYFQRQSELAGDEGWKLPDV